MENYNLIMERMMTSSSRRWDMSGAFLIHSVVLDTNHSNANYAKKVMSASPILWEETYSGS